MEKKCSKCERLKALDEFYPRRDGHLGRRGICRACMRPGEQAFREKYKHNRPHVARKSLYGLNQAEYETLLSSQGGTCAICGFGGRLVVDHCHGTKVVRGILCNECNLTIGYAKDSPELLRLAAEYLEKHNEPKD